MKKPKTPPTEEQIQDSIRLRALFEKRAKMSQLDFGQAYGIGNQGMVWQYLNADKPKGSVLNVAAAIKFAEGLGCRVSDFSPALQREVDKIASFASDHATPRTPDTQHGSAEERLVVIEEAKTRADENTAGVNPDSSLLKASISVARKYQDASPARQEVVNFLLLENGKPHPAWVDGDARAYTDSLEMKAYKWITGDKSSGDTKTGT